jgi:hypothetical protein
MNKQEFRVRLNALGLSMRRFAIIINMDPVTVQVWGGTVSSGQHRPFPGWVHPLLSVWEKHPELLAQFIASLDGRLVDAEQLAPAAVPSSDQNVAGD